ncbi:MAG: response regulator, partial [Desulfobacteraceae bacterium]|nr:response regulator [Candidatus Desulfacyla euxinica]MBL6977609.1 response regulator [Desulfobacteraceae bacterium]
MNKKILLVEDNEMNRELATDLLELAGYVIIPAETAEEGLKLAREELPDLILMDISLPGMDGIEAAGILKQDDETKDIPVVALSAHAMKGDEEKALVAGLIGYITKPIDTRAFSTEVGRF